MIALLTVLFKGETSNSFIQLLRYTLIGGLAFLLDTGLLFALHRLVGLHYLLAAAIAFTSGTAATYACSICWVFDQRSVKNRYAEFLIYAFLGIVGLGITLGTLYLLTGVLGSHLLLSKIVAAGITFGWNFLSRKTLLFSSFSPVAV